jgi:hypothetical protein
MLSQVRKGLSPISRIHQAKLLLTEVAGNLRIWKQELMLRQRRM